MLLNTSNEKVLHYTHVRAGRGCALEMLLCDDIYQKVAFHYTYSGIKRQNVQYYESQRVCAPTVGIVDLLTFI